MNIWKIRNLGVVFLCAALTNVASASDSTCHGNIETFDKKLIQPGVTYFLRYDVSGTKAKIKFAGREFDAVVEKGSSWKGLWMKNLEAKEYFSFLPDEGGTLKFAFEPNRWFSGNCQ